MELLIDGDRGITLPKYFYETIDWNTLRDKDTNKAIEKWEYVELKNVFNENYWDAWEDLLSRAIVTTNEGDFLLYQDGDLFLATEEELQTLENF